VYSKIQYLNLFLQILKTHSNNSRSVSFTACHPRCVCN